MAEDTPEFRLRRTWPDCDHIFCVLNRAGERIGRIALDNHSADQSQPWSWGMSYEQYRHRPDFTGRCATLDECKAKVREAWPAYAEAMAYDDHFERVRRARLGPGSITFFDAAEYEAAPALIEALAGGLEDTWEDAELSRLVFARRHWQDLHGLPPDE